MRVGIDFGTTNSGIAIYDGKKMHLFKVDEQLPDLLPSIIYITKQFAEYVGSEARDLYLQLVTGLLCGRDAPLLLGTLWSKFLPTTAHQNHLWSHRTGAHCGIRPGSSNIRRQE